MWDSCGSGLASVVTSLYLCLYYNVINAWSFWYLFNSFQVSCCWMISSDACCWMRPHWNTSMFTVCPALGGLPRKFQPDRTSWGVWESYTHPVFLLQRNSGHIPLHWAEWTHSHRPGSVPCAGMGHYFPLHCAGGQVHRKGKKSSPLCGTLCAGLNNNTSSPGIKPPTSWLLFWSFGGIFVSSQSQRFAPLWPPSSYSFML